MPQLNFKSDFVVINIMQQMLLIEFNLEYSVECINICCMCSTDTSNVPKNFFQHVWTSFLVLLQVKSIMNNIIYDSTRKILAI